MKILTAVVLSLVLGGGSATAQVGASQGVVDPNIAAEQDLRSVPHFSASLVTALLAERPFPNQVEFDAWLGGRGLNPEQRKESYAKVFIALNLNAATREEILMVPGSGPRVVREFLEYRPYEALPRFTREMRKYWDADEVARLEQYVFVPVNINTAADEVMMTIPGVGPRMIREFKEYRPWRSAEQFRREIGKYVSAKEVTRLEHFVTW